MKPKSVKAWAVMNKECDYKPPYCADIYFSENRARYHLWEVKSNDLEIVEVLITPLSPNKKKK